MDHDKRFSQAESKLVANYLREKYMLSVPNSLIFWRKTPSEVEEGVKRLWDVNVDKKKLCMAAGRE